MVIARLRDIANPSALDAKADRSILWQIILYAMAFKLLIAITLPLGVDEAYATAVAREFSLSFFDHPPISFWLPVIFAHLTGIENKLIYRLPFLLAGFATAPIMYLIGRELAGKLAGLWSVFLYTAAPFFLISAGILVVPDGTLNLGLALAVLFLIRIVKADDTPPLRYWVYTGVGLALALGSKYQAAWLPVAVLLFMVMTPKGRRWFLQPGPWIGAALGLIGLAPVIIWNMQHDWASFAFHTSRAGGEFNLRNPALMLAGQALFLLPSGLFAAIAGLRLGLRRGMPSEYLLLALIALGPIVIFNYLYFTSTGSLAHWPMPGWQFALPLGAVWLAGKSQTVLHRFFNWTIGFLVLIWTPLLLFVVQADTGILTRPFYSRAPGWDYTLSAFDFGGLHQALVARGLWKSTDVFMADGWEWGGLLDTALQSKKPMRIINKNSAHHFAYLSDAKATGTTLFMGPATLRDTKTTNERMLKQAKKIDPGARLLKPIILMRDGQPYVTISLVRLQLK